MDRLAMGRLDRLEWLARSGYISRGAVYLIIGWFAMAAAIGAGQPTDTRGALREILLQPFGKVLLGAVALGLAGYALWRAMQAGLDLDDHGTDAKGLAIRGGLLTSSVIHAVLAFFAISLALGWQGPSEGNGDGTRDWTAWLLAQPFGRWMVGAVGIAVFGAAAGHFVKAYKASFLRHLKTPPDAERMICLIGRIGLTAKGGVFLLTGAFFFVAAWQLDPSESGGLGKALLTLQEQPYGPWLLGVMAAGLFAFGVYSVIQGLYRHIDSPAVVSRLQKAV